MAKVGCWKEVHVAESSALGAPLAEAETLVPVGCRNSFQQQQHSKELVSLLGFPEKTAHSFQVQA